MSAALTIDEVAERLHCNRDHVRHLIACGHLAASDISAGHQRRRMWRITPETIDAFLAARRASMASHPSNFDELAARKRGVRAYAN